MDDRLRSCRGWHWLSGKAGLAPIRLHVNAKRCLRHTEASDFEGLSPASVGSLTLQSGVFSAMEAEAFLQRPRARVALRPRLYNDRAKVPGAPTPPLEHFVALMRRIVKPVKAPTA